MKMNRRNKEGFQHYLQKSSSCEQISFTTNLTNNDASAPSATHSSCRCSFKSTEDLPSAVAECFQDSSFMNKIQNSFFLFIGRGSRYKIINSTGCSFLSLLNQRRKELESNAVLVVSKQKEDPKVVKRKEPLKQVNSLPVRPKTTSPPTVEKHLNIDQKNGEVDKGEKYSYIDEEDNKNNYKEDSLLRQYLTLQQLAVARRHCSQLRRIRDSLNGKSCCSLSKRCFPTKEQEELRNFLMDVGFVQYYALLNRHGYDLETTSQMNAFDLAAVGITEPLHRMALKYELDQVRRPIEPVESIPETVDEWLENLSLPDYVEHFKVNGIYCPLAAVGLTKRDLQLMGIYLLGHRKKIVIALTAIGLTISGKRPNSKKGISDS